MMAVLKRNIERATNAQVHMVTVSQDGPVESEKSVCYRLMRSLRVKEVRPLLKMKDAASEFLANEHVAVTGVSRNAQSHGANVIYQRLRQRGYQVFAVNPNADEVEGDPCYHDLKSDTRRG